MVEFLFMILLDKNTIAFPNPLHYDSVEQGLIAIGGDLSPERVLFAYQHGIFPWFNDGEDILWWCPDPRFVLFPKDLKVFKSMKKIMRDNTFTFSENQDFERVIHACAHINRPAQDGTWITKEMIKTYTALHNMGYAKSIEVYQDDELVGGLYGMMVNGIFCGESMFSRVSNSSKAGLIYFIQKHQATLKLIDCQIHSNLLESLGAKMISKTEFLSYLGLK